LPTPGIISINLAFHWLLILTYYTYGLELEAHTAFS